MNEEDLGLINEALDNVADKIKYTLSIPFEYQSSCEDFNRDYLWVEGNVMYFVEGFEGFDITKFCLFNQREIDNLPNQKFIQSLNKEVYKGE